MRWESAPGKRKSKIKVKPWQNPITTVGYSPVGDRGVHSKMAILDRILVIAGSQTGLFLETT